MPRKKRIENRLDFSEEKVEAIQFFKDWDKEDEERANDYIDALFDVMFLKLLKAEAKIVKQAKTIKALETRLSNANYDISYSPLSQEALHQLSGLKVAVFRLHPEDRKQVQRLIKDVNDEIFWETQTKNFWHSIDVEEPRNEYVATEILRGFKEENRRNTNIIFFRSPKEKNTNNSLCLACPQVGKALKNPFKNMLYFIHKVRFNQPTNKLEEQIQEAVKKFSCTATDNPQSVYEEICKAVGERNEANKRCAYQVVQSHSHEWEKQPHTITIASHKKAWGNAHTTILFEEIGLLKISNTSPTILGFSGFSAYMANVARHLTKALRDIATEINEPISRNIRLSHLPDPIQKFDAPLWAFVRCLATFAMYAKNPENPKIVGEVFEIFGNPNYFYLKWKNDFDGNTMRFLASLNDEELMVIYKAYEADLRKIYVF